MATPTITGVTELADWLGEAIVEGTSEHKRAQMCLRIASALVREEAGQSWLDDSGELVGTVPDPAIMVTLYSAGRVYENREAQTSEGVDDWSGRWKVEESGAYLTASEKRMLAPLRGSAFGGIGVVSTTRGYTPPSSSTWVPTDTEDVEFPWY